MIRKASLIWAYAAEVNTLDELVLLGICIVEGSCADVVGDLGLLSHVRGRWGCRQWLELSPALWARSLSSTRLIAHMHSVRRPITFRVRTHWSLSLATWIRLCKVSHDDLLRRSSWSDVLGLILLFVGIVEGVGDYVDFRACVWVYSLVMRFDACRVTLLGPLNGLRLIELLRCYRPLYFEVTASHEAAVEVTLNKLGCVIGCLALYLDGACPIHHGHLAARRHGDRVFCTLKSSLFEKLSGPTRAALLVWTSSTSPKLDLLLGLSSSELEITYLGLLATSCSSHAVFHTSRHVEAQLRTLVLIILFVACLVLLLPVITGNYLPSIAGTFVTLEALDLLSRLAAWSLRASGSNLLGSTSLTKRVSKSLGCKLLSIVENLLAIGILSYLVYFTILVQVSIRITSLMSSPMLWSSARTSLRSYYSSWLKRRVMILLPRMLTVLLLKWRLIVIPHVILGVATSLNSSDVGVQSTYRMWLVLVERCNSRPLMLDVWSGLFLIRLLTLSPLQCRLLSSSCWLILLTNKSRNCLGVVDDVIVNVVIIDDICNLLFLLFGLRLIFVLTSVSAWLSCWWPAITNAWIINFVTHFELDWAWFLEHEVVGFLFTFLGAIWFFIWLLHKFFWRLVLWRFGAFSWCSIWVIRYSGGVFSFLLDYLGNNIGLNAIVLSNVELAEVVIFVLAVLSTVKGVFFVFFLVKEVWSSKWPIALLLVQLLSLRCLLFTLWGLSL